MNLHLISPELKNKIFDALSGGDREWFDRGAEDAWESGHAIDAISREFSATALNPSSFYSLRTSFDDDEQATDHVTELCVVDGVGLCFEVDMPGYCDENYDAYVRVSAFPQAEYDAQVANAKKTLVQDVLKSLQAKLGKDFAPLVLAELSPKPVKPKRKAKKS